MTKLHLVCAWLCLAVLISATPPAHIHEARQGPISIIPLTTGLDPESTQTPSSTSVATSPETTATSTETTATITTTTVTMSPALATSLLLSSPDTPTSSSPSPQSTSSAPQPSSTSYASSLDFTVKNMTTCTPGLISWKYSGQDTPLLLSITNIGVSEMVKQSTNVDAAILKQLVNTTTSTQSWEWPSVNLTQGWYEINGTVISSTTLRSSSAPFFISNGTDVTCLAAILPQASSTTALPTATAVPPPAASKSHVASIAGGVVGGVVGVTFVIIAGVWLWLRRQKPSFVAQGGRKDGAWGSLKSTSSSIHPGGNGSQFANHHFHAHSESTGAILQDSVGGKASATTTPGGSDEDVIVMCEEKLVSPASSSGMSPFDALNTPIQYGRRISAYSVQTPTTAASDPFRSRAPSVRSSNQSLEQQAQRIRSSMETSNRRRGDRLSMPTLPSPGLSRIPPSPTQTQTREEYPLTAITPTPVNRSISAGAVSMTARRTSRKPVPQYDSSLLLEDRNTDSVSTLTAGAESSQSHGTGLGTGTHGTTSGLLHKASFGDGRPVHYLIPDMPPPQQD